MMRFLEARDTQALDGKTKYTWTNKIRQLRTEKETREADEAQL